MQTTKLLLLTSMVFLGTRIQAQVRGNYDFRSSVQMQTAAVRLPQAGSLTSLSGPGNHTFSIKGLYNCEADSYLAIFTITQTGKTQRETDSLVSSKIEAIKAALTSKATAVEVYVDMISFIPIFEVEHTKKLFSKDTYNEIPKGFELKQNLHFRYTEPAMLNELVSLCAREEIYDLVRVDYFVDDLAAKKAELMARAETLLNLQLSRYQKILGEDFNQFQKLLSDGFAMHYPLEQYQSYTAYCSNKLNVVQENGTFVPATKTTSEFYMPKTAKGYDFVINSSLLKPVVQIEYELLFNVAPKPEKPEKQAVKEVVKTEIEKQVILVTQDGEVKKLPL
ncbi:MAG TPA: SIMPL domain-containing protein [Cryomorphaceae bacterium]|nr:SIMPL domain-containing protein [Owenweeksia sp.]HBF19060.1 SIMPL domain-containing protein [Cryomorphaceae bacterium]|tara:strand:+ start:735 stop:1742 length:1008 start_codon:yes stop_codon:yes gene_type:complete